MEKKNLLVVDFINVVGGIECPTCKKMTEHLYVFTSRLPQWTKCDNCKDWADDLMIILDKQRRIDKNKVLCN